MYMNDVYVSMTNGKDYGHFSQVTRNQYTILIINHTGHPVTST